ncbi:hypothetical protein [Tersicoccus sp. Bi-70]|uniref:hypothetical protein n=1 Tax=Tersicoccus sp. Bi-70 TaxID=1897634 RepID=UPI000976A448|nr:hypothetical protein [Tersicoccus sp. Bi-70]OMH35146.1 hypothetical protein BGP79_02230 [Tersicoccus sp. Bi-70]
MERTARHAALATPTPAARITTAGVIAVAFYGTFLVVLLRTDIIDSAWYPPFVLVAMGLGYILVSIVIAVLTGWHRDRPLDLPHERLTWLGTRRYRRTSTWTGPLGADEALTQLRRRLAIVSTQLRVLDGGLWVELERDIGSDVDAATMGVRERAAVDVLVIVDPATPAGTAGGSRVTVHHGRSRWRSAAPDGGMTARLADQLLLVIRDITGG